MMLRELALKHGTDKAGGNENSGCHEFCEAYEFFLGPVRYKPFVMVEIGVGGYEYPDRGGESLRMWSEYFPHATIIGIDVHPKTLQIPNVTILQGSQDDQKLANEVLMMDKYGRRPEVIIDDGSHVNPQTLATFNVWWPVLARGGLYVIEDVHTSYWDKHGYEGGFGKPNVMNYFLYQSHALNINHWDGTATLPFEYHPIDGIESIHFFKEIIFIRKKM